MAGHLQHLYDNRELTFREIKEVLSLAASGKLEQVSEKLDGLNLVFTWDMSTQSLRAARNAGDIKSGGMDAVALAAKFADRGSLTEAFSGAFKVLRQAIGVLPGPVMKKVFGSTGSIWYSLEVIYSKNPNVINYDGNNVVFHQSPVFQLARNGSIEKGTGDGANILAKYIDKMQAAVTEKNWQVRGPSMLRLQKMTDGSIVQRALQEIDAAMNAAGVSDQDNLGNYIQQLASKDVNKTFKVHANVKREIVNRVIGAPGAQSVIALKKLVPKQEYETLRKFVQNSPDMLKKYIRPIELAVNRFAIEVLRGLQSTLISDNDAEVMRLRGEVSKAISAIEKSGNEDAMAILKSQMEKLGDLKNISAAMEGVVFIYKGKPIKFTGNFAAANQILGLFKYGRAGIKFQQEALLRNYVHQVIFG
jgi:hypothetical protein